MTTLLVACAICGRPLDSLLASGLQAGVLVLAAIALLVIGIIARAGWRLLREEARGAER